MARGFEMPNLSRGIDYDALRDSFEWDIPEKYNIANDVFQVDNDSQDRPALLHVDQSGSNHTISYEAMEKASDILASTFEGWGIEENDRIALCFPQSPELLIAHLACYKIGAITVPISVLLGKNSLTYQLSNSDSKALIFDEDVFDKYKDKTEVFDSVERSIGISLDSRRYSKSHEFLGGFYEVADASSSFDSSSTTPDSPASLLYTSGTTGNPKGVLLPHRYLIGCLPGFLLWFHLFDTESAVEGRFWTPAEWAWAGGLFSLVFPTLACGGTVVSKERRSGFNPREALSFINKYEVNYAFLPPTVFKKIRDESNQGTPALQTLDIVMSGGEPLSSTLKTWVESEFDIVINDAYGLTEANAVVGNCEILFDYREGSIGRAYPGHDIQVISETGEAAEYGELGELVITSPDPVFFLEYWDDSKATQERFTGDGHLKTGDMVTIDPEGYIEYRGRKDDMIISSGYRISPLEIEESLENHPHIENAVVGGIPESEGLTQIKAYISLIGDLTREEADYSLYKQHVRAELGAHKTPDVFESLAELPVNARGKVDRQYLFQNSSD